MHFVDDVVAHFPRNNVVFLSIMSSLFIDKNDEPRLRVCLATTKPGTLFGPFASLGHLNSPHQADHCKLL